MSSPPVPDPYIALGLPKDATQAQVKATYRKLALKYHPDKVTDDALKAAAADNFHRIQQGYEILGDEDRRGRYDAQARLMALRKDVLERQSTKVDVRTAAFEVPTSSPGRTAFTARGPERMTEERKPSNTYAYEENDYFGTARPTSRKNSEYGREYRGYGRDEPEKVKVYAKENEKNKREERRKVSERDRGRMRDERRRTPYIQDDSDSDPSDLSRIRRHEDEREKEQYFAKRHKDARDDYHRDSDRSRKYSSALDEARDYISRAKGGRNEDERPSTSRRSSAKDPYADSRRDARPPVMVRRSSARPTTSGRDERRSAKERKYSEPENIYTETRKPTLQSFSSSPAAIRMPETRRASTMQSKYESPEFAAPQYRRSDSMPLQSSKESTSRRRESNAPHVSSKLRPTEFDNGIPTPSASPDYPSPDQYQTTSTKYRVGEDVGLGISNGRRTAVVEPERTRYHSPEAMERDRDYPRDSPRAVDRKGRTVSGRQPPPLRTSQTHAGTFSPQDTPISVGRPSPIHRYTSENIQPGTLFDGLPTTPSGNTRRYDYSDRQARDIDRERERLERDVELSLIHI